MSYTIPNARVSTFRNGTPIFTNILVQIDDGPSTGEMLIEGVPIISKTIYDVPSQTYQYGDRVQILEIAGHGTLVPNDSIFWVRRAILAGSPLPATEVGIFGGIQSNTTVNVYRPALGKVIQTGLRVYYIMSGPERFTSEGGALAGTIYLADTTTNLQLDDIINITAGDDLTVLDPQTQYQVGATLRAAAPVPHIRADINTVIGTFQQNPF